MEEYLNNLLDQIRCKKAHAAIREELESHISDQIEDNMKAGMTREEAEKRSCGQRIKKESWFILSSMILNTMKRTVWYQGLISLRCGEYSIKIWLFYIEQTPSPVFLRKS